MSNFSPKLEDAADEQLRRWVNEGNFQVVPLASDELTRRSIKKLNESVDKNISELKKFSNATGKFNKETAEQTDKTIRMTRTMTFLTWVMAFAVIVQIFLTIPLKQNCFVSISSDRPNVEKHNCSNRLDFGVFGSIDWKSYEEKPNAAF